MPCATTCSPVLQTPGGATHFFRNMRAGLDLYGD